MSTDKTQDFALTRAQQVVETDPETAFDLVLASDRIARKDPDVIVLNRAMRKIKTAAVKFLDSKTGIVWEAGPNYDYMDLGTTVRFHGFAAAGDSRSIAGIEVNFVRPNTQYDPPGHYGVLAQPSGKNGRKLDGGNRAKLTLDDMKSKPSEYLGKSASSIKANLDGSTEQEKKDILGRIQESMKEADTLIQELKALESAVKASKNLATDAADLRSKVPSGQTDFNLSGIRRTLEEIARAGG